MDKTASGYLLSVYLLKMVKGTLLWEKVEILFNIINIDLWLQCIIKALLFRCFYINILQELKYYLCKLDYISRWSKN